MIFPLFLKIYSFLSNSKRLCSLLLCCNIFSFNKSDFDIAPFRRSPIPGGFCFIEDEISYKKTNVCFAHSRIVMNYE